MRETGERHKRKMARNKLLRLSLMHNTVSVALIKKQKPYYLESRSFAMLLIKDDKSRLSKHCS